MNSWATIGPIGPVGTALMMMGLSAILSLVFSSVVIGIRPQIRSITLTLLATLLLMTLTFVALSTLFYNYFGSICFELVVWRAALSGVVAGAVALTCRHVFSVSKTDP